MLHTDSEASNATSYWRMKVKSASTIEEITRLELAFKGMESLEKELSEAVVVSSEEEPDQGPVAPDLTLEQSSRFDRPRPLVGRWRKQLGCRRRRRSLSYRRCVGGADTRFSIWRGRCSITEGSTTGVHGATLQGGSSGTQGFDAYHATSTWAIDEGLGRRSTPDSGSGLPSRKEANEIQILGSVACSISSPFVAKRMVFEVLPNGRVVDVITCTRKGTIAVQSIPHVSS